MHILNSEIDPKTIAVDTGGVLVTARTFAGDVVYLKSYNPLVWVTETCAKVEGLAADWMVKQLEITYVLAQCPLVW